MTRPNILLITADDLAGDTPGSFGGRPDVMPVLDRLAAEGMRFGRAHVPAPVCQPSRSALMTGRWPHRNGAEGFEPIDEGVPLLTEAIGAVGYRSGILGKVNHLQPEDRFGWSFVRQQAELGMGRNPQAYGDATAEFIAASEGESWFLMANAHDPHRPFHGSAAEREGYTEEQQASYPDPSRVFTAQEADPPGFLPDLPQVRQEYAQYLSSARRCDDVIAAILAALEDSGQAERTVVVFFSDNGMAFPFAKANCYLAGTRTPLVVRWPDQVPPGGVNDDHFVSTLDLFATFCEMAGAEIPDGVDGRSVVGLLQGRGEPGRDHVVTVFHETNAGNRYEMRSVQDGEWGYIWNAWSDGETAYRAENMAGLTWPAMTDAAETDTALKERTDFYQRRAPEELYRLTTDPHALHNLVESHGRTGDPDSAQALARARAHLRDWMDATEDPLRERYPASR
ncbi:sulfatase family protein [Ruania alba]|uniref:Arylsulfatase A n=1 Tax=Ruania alba TaxID=648782 RepID=A0A1H5LB42_9MICO|nr:sulfatase [Ruania alba]SEE74225.1 Arylsulfatase A [Ruania alba]